jgi:hypothetical protein
MLACTACTLEEEVIDNGGSTPVASSDARVNFSITVPSPVQTRAANPDEGAVDRVYLLLFENIGGVRTYRYRIVADNISAVSGTQKTFSAILPMGVYDIAVLANATEIINGSGISFGDTKEQVLGALVETNTGKWSRSNIPMWGQKNDQTIGEGTDFTGSKAIPMIRMIAKIEIDVTPNAAGTNSENFSLTDIRLYNYSSRGTLVPDPGNWQPAETKVTYPTTPAGGYATMRYPDKEPLVFDSKIFYTYEAPAGGKGAAMASNTCLIIGGSYRGGAPSYYRVDFVDKGSAPDAFLPLLRNHHYLVKIVNVAGDGYPTPEIAFETVRSNMEATIVRWNDGGMDDVVVDGQNSLEVSKSAFTFLNTALTAQTADNRLTIRTTVAGGWEIEKITDESGSPNTATWLTTSETSSSDPSKDIYLFAQENRTGAERTACIHLRAGRLSFRVTVTQKDVFDIHITDSNGNDITELTFPLQGGTKTFNVDWEPATTSVTAINTAVGKDADGNSVYFSGTGLPNPGAGVVTITGGSKTYSVQADAWTGDPLIHRATKVDFTIVDGAEIVTRSMFLRQFDLSVVPVMPSTFFLLDGDVKFIGVRSNTTWQVIDVIDNDNIITNKAELIGKSGGMNISARGEQLSFRLKDLMDNTNTSVHVAYICIRDAQGKDYWVTITARAVYKVGNLLVWPEDMPNTDRNWYQLSDVPEDTDDAATPPLGPRNPTVNPLSCAAIDSLNKDDWRLPAINELEEIFKYVKSNGGYDKYGMKNADAKGDAIATDLVLGYWTAETHQNIYSMAFIAGYNTVGKKIVIGANSKGHMGVYGGSYGQWPIYARCVRTK